MNKLDRFNPTDMAYIAGLFDGEGCIFIGRAKRNGVYSKYQLLVNLSNNDAGLVRELTALYDGRVSETTTARKHVNYIMCLRSLKAMKFLVEVYPYLRIKRAQADLALDFQAHMSSRGPGVQRKVSESDIKYRESCYIKMKHLKRAYFVSVHGPLSEDLDESTNPEPAG